MGLIQKQFADLFTFTRASSGGRFNAQGVYEMVPANQPRIDYDPVTGECKGILIEEQRTNLCTNSVFAGAVGGVVGKGAVAPNGFVHVSSLGSVSYPNGTSVRFVKSGSERPALGYGFTASPNTTYSFTVSVDSIEGAPTETLNTFLVAANLPPGTTYATYKNGVSTGGGDVVTVGVHELRVVVGATGGGVQLRFGPGAFSSLNSLVCTVSRPQLEAGAFPTSYIPTSGSQVTRAADVCSINTLSPWYNQSEGTIYVESVLANTVPSGAFGIAAMTDGTSANFIGARYDTAGANISAVALSGGVNQTTVSKSGGVGTLSKTAISWSSGVGRYVSTNGSTASGQSGYTQISPTQMNIGWYPSANYLNGHIRKLRYYPKRLTDAQLQAMTA